MDFRRILKEPKNALVSQYKLLLEVEGLSVEFTDDALDELASIAAALNERTENIGARRLHTVMERLLEQELFEAPEIVNKHLLVDAQLVSARLGVLVGDPSSFRVV